MTCRGMSLDTKGLYRLHSWEGYYYQSLQKYHIQKILNNKNPKVDSCDTSNKIASQELSFSFILSFVFYYTNICGQSSMQLS